MSKNVPGGKIKPFYFGTPTEPLFGCYHVPRTQVTRACGVVLCYPMGEEYIRAHRVYMQLAVRLSNVGYHVLRFDLYGCGDSGGECEQGRIDRWLIDISTAIDELLKRSGLVEICLVGLRLGGTLAMIAGTERRETEGLVLWDPVISGRAYVEELTTKRQYLETHDQAVWFPLTAPMVADLKKIDLLAVPRKPATNILLFESNDEAQAAQLRMHLESTGAHLKYQHQPDQKAWLKPPGDEFNEVLLIPRKTLDFVVTWISEVFP